MPFQAGRRAIDFLSRQERPPEKALEITSASLLMLGSSPFQAERSLFAEMSGEFRPCRGARLCTPIRGPQAGPQRRRDHCGDRGETACRAFGAGGICGHEAAGGDRRGEPWPRLQRLIPLFSAAPVPPPCEPYHCAKSRVRAKSMLVESQGKFLSCHPLAYGFLGLATPSQAGRRSTNSGERRASLPTSFRVGLVHDAPRQRSRFREVLESFPGCKARKMSRPNPLRTRRLRRPSRQR